jgi:hypothetical protein
MPGGGGGAPIAKGFGAAATADTVGTDFEGGAPPSPSESVLSNFTSSNFTWISICCNVLFAF